MTASISIVIITFNEEKNIDRCLSSVKEFADEIILIDSGSTDNTRHIAADHGAQVTLSSWAGYSGNKNLGNSKATCDYIFSIDADEEVSPELNRSILEFKENPTADVLSVSRITNYCGQWIRHCGWYPDRKDRLFKKGTAEWVGDIHEKLYYDDSCTHLKLSGDLLHYSFPTITSHADTANRFSEIAANELFKKGKKANILWHLILNPTFTFFKKYIFDLGLLDGYNGFVICYLSAYSNFLKYSKLIALYRAKDLAQ